MSDFSELYARLTKTEGVEHLNMNKRLADHMVKRISIDRAGCWIWSNTTPQNYARLLIWGKAMLVHRLSYMLASGPIPEGFQIDHLCKVRSCCNPQHLEATTPSLNNARSDSLSGENTRKTHCKRGHPLSGENLRYTVRNERQCRKCDAIRAANYQRKKGT